MQRTCQWCLTAVSWLSIAAICAAAMIGPSGCKGLGGGAGQAGAEGEPPIPPLPSKPPFELQTTHRLKSTWPPAGQPIKLPVTRDDWLSAMGEEVTGNNGGATQLKLKGQQEYSIFDVDTSALKGKIITGALWHVHSATPKDAPLLRVTVSTLASPWVEGTSSGYKPQEGSACFNQAALGKQDWTYPGSTFIDAAYGRSHTLWAFAEATAPDQNDWQTIVVSPDVVAARAAGLSHGFAAYDDVGNIWSYEDNVFNFTYHPNRFIHSREQTSFAPYLEVWVAGEDNTPPEPIKEIKVNTSEFPAGEALVRWTSPADQGGGKTLGFQVTYKAGGKEMEMPRYLVPMAGWEGKEVRMHIHDLPFKAGERIELQIRPVDSAGNVGEVFAQKIQLSSAPRVFAIASAKIKPFAPSEVLPEVGGLKVAVIDLLDKVTTTGKMIPAHPAGYLGGNHLWSAEKKLIRLHAARNEHVCFQVNLAGKSGAAELALSFPQEAGVKTKLYRLDYVQTSAGSVPDVAVPLTGMFTIPSKDDPEAAQASNRSLLCEIYVPHEAMAGTKLGTLSVSSAGQRQEFQVELNVWKFTLPNKLSFIPEMNAYGTVTPTTGLGYYRLAHEHRCCLNRLYYGWNGTVSLAPSRTEAGWDWTSWDRDVGPLLDGSAFKDLPRSGEPVDEFYLPFNENWPADIYANYTKNYWADEALTEKYKNEMRQAFADFAAHFNKKGWHDTHFQFYLNNKVYYKKPDNFRNSSAPWIFDEPVDTQDFWALRFYGILWHEGVDPVKGKAKMWYRTDISRSNYGRDMPWGVQDLVFFGGSNAQKVRMKHDEQVLWGPTYFAEYGSANDPAGANLQPAVWCLLAWSRGAISVLPWQTIAGKGAWTKAEATDVFFPGAGGPFASIRLKAFRRGQQDVEYLTLLGDAYGQPHFAVAAGAQQIVELGGKVLKRSAEDAGEIRFDRSDPVGLWTLRQRVAQMVSAKAPAYKRVVREMPSPPRDMTVLPDIGYVRIAPEVPSSKPE